MMSTVFLILFHNISFNKSDNHDNTRRKTMTSQLRKMTMTMLIAVLMMIPMTTVQAKPGPGAAMNGRPGMFIGLDLTDNQIELLKNDKIKRHKRMISLRSDLETVRVDLAEAASAKVPNMREIDRLSNRIGDIRGQMTAERTKGIVYMRSLLTDEQKRKMDTRRIILGMMKDKGKRGFGR